MSETRIALALLKGLEAWQIANVAAFTASGIAQSAPVGAPYRDESGQEYQPMFVEPALVFAARPSRMRRTLARALERDLAVAVYTRGMFTTFNDADNRAVVADAKTEDLDLVGLAMYGPAHLVEETVKGLSLHR